MRLLAIAALVFAMQLWPGPALAGEAVAKCGATDSAERRALVGVSGGAVSAGPVRLVVPYGALRRDTMVVLSVECHEALGGARAGGGRLVATAEPFGLQSAIANRPFLVEWRIDGDEVARIKKGQLCGAVSWTRDAKQDRCYEPAWVPLEHWTERPMAPGCEEMRASLTGTESSERVRILSDRLGHFSFAKERNETAAGGPHSCVEIPPIEGRWVGVSGETYSASVRCRRGEECGPGQYCRHGGDCGGWGNCDTVPVTCEDVAKRLVCSCRGRTFDSVCQAQRAGQDAWRYGKCSELGTYRDELSTTEGNGGAVENEPRRVEGPGRESPGQENTD